MSITLGIRKKIILSFLFLVLVMSSVFALTSYINIMKATQNEIQKRGYEVVKTLSKMVAPYIFVSDYATIFDHTEQLIDESDIQLFTIFDTRGKTWLTTHSSLTIGSTDEPFYQNIIKNNIVGYRQAKRDGHNIMEFVSPISALGKVLYLLKIEISLESIEKQAIERIREVVVISCVMVIVATLLGVLLSKLLTDPLEKLVHGTNEISHGNLTHRIAVQSTDEIGTLSESFNLMTDNLEKELFIRKNAERELKDHRDRLEETVAERTAQLIQTNDRISREIEEHKKTESALRESEERYKRFSEVTIDGIVFHNRYGIIDTNATFNKLFGYSQGELLGRDLTESICLPKHHDTINEEFASHSEKFIATTGKRKDGATMPIEMQSSVLKHDNVTLTVTSVRDITERKVLEAQLHQAQKMKSIGLMAGGVAHDLNNILSGIVTYPEVILLDLPEDSTLRPPLEIIKESGTRAAEVVFDLLTVARGAASSRELENLNNLIEEYIGSPEYIRVQNLHPRVTLKTDLDPDLFNISCSPTHVKKSIMNLISNAAEAIGEEGEIIVSTRNQYIDEPIAENIHLKEGEYVIFSVSDSGPGISEEDMERIFDPFYSKKKMGLNSGSGLGLTVVWNTAQDHEGSVTVESSALGTVFFMYLPSTREDLEIHPTDLEVENLHGKGEHLLIIDDDENQQIITKNLLSSIGYNVDVVGSGEEAIDYLKTHSVDLLILDMILGIGMTGRQTYAQIKTFLPELKAIIVSGFSADIEVKETQRLGAGQFVKKPFTLSQIGAAIKEELYS